MPKPASSSVAGSPCLLPRPCVLGVLGPLLAVSAAAAQADADPQADTDVLPEVTVTAERSPTALRRTPLSVGVIDGRTIDRQGIAQLNDLVGRVAGVSVPNGFSNMPQAVGIRGVGVSQPAMSQAVGIYVDDVPLVRGYATALWDLPDIERIEVLRGPQGTLYGQNSTAGAVKYLSIDPSRDTNAWMSLGAGNKGTWEARGYANGPLGDGPLSASIAFSHRQNDGYGYNATLAKSVNRLDATQFRAKLRWEHSASLNAVLSVDGLRDTSDTNTFNFPLNHPNTRPRVTYASNPWAGEFERLAGGVSLKVENLISDGLKFRSITGYRAYKDDPTIADWGGLERLSYQILQTIEQKVLSQEFQLQGKDDLNTWTAGLMVVADEFEFARYVDSAPPSPAPLGHSEAQTRQKTLDLGLYGQLRHALTKQTGLIAGIRLYRTRQTAANAFWRTDDQRQRTVTVYVADDLDTAKTGLLPRLGIDHQLTPDTFVYASLAQGAKFGGFNRAAESSTSAQTATDPEKVTTWELGSKTRLLDGRMGVNVALFFNDYRDYLASVPNMTINGVLLTDAVLVNAGKAKTYGLDLDMSARLTSRIDWNLSLELLRTRFDEFANPTGAASADFVGNELPYAPRVSAGSTISYRHPFSGGGSGTLHATVQYLGSQYTDIANNDVTKVVSQNYVHAGASFTDASQRWTFSLRVRNLFDKTYVLLHNRIPPLGLHAAYYNPPRTVLLTARHDF